MLKGIPKSTPPELLKILCEMGHGDEIILADANFPSANYAKRLVRMDGIDGATVLKTVLSLIPVDTYSDPNVILMKMMPCDEGKIHPVIWDTYKEIAKQEEPNTAFGNIDRFAFYERAKTAYAVIATGETALYACAIIKKGVL